MFVSGGSVITKSVLWEGTPATYDSALNILGARWSTYEAMYRDQLWVSVVVDKRAGMVARLPLKVYRRNDQDSRDGASDSAYGLLLARPNPTVDPFTFWSWISSTRDIYGESFLLKARDPGGRPIALTPAHPTRMHLERNGTWTFRGADTDVTGIPAHDVIVFKTYNPNTIDRGMSKLEPLRATLENEWHARNATSAFWRNGARPGTALIHPKNISDGAARRLKAQWDSIAAGSGNTGTTVVLEEGLTPQKMTLSAEEAQYIETRKLNREEVVAGYDMPPPAVHILDRATFSNITEQFRSVYRDTMAPILGYFEAVLEFQLRGSVIPGRSDPDFGADVYAEFLMDEVLRGDFETRQDALNKATYMTLAEKRQLENLPFIEGTDRIFLPAGVLPLSAIDDQATALAERITQGGTALSGSTLRSVMGRLSRMKSLADIDGDVLVSGLPDAAPVVSALAVSRAAGDDLAAYKSRLRALTEE